MERKMKLSIIVPIYNVEKYLERCILSLLNQDIPKNDYEIIMVNDGSTDSSYDIAQELAKESDNIILLTQENQGLSGARNTGMKLAKGDYLMFVDSDDYIEQNILSCILSFVQEKQLDICNYKMVVDKADGHIIHFNKSKFADGNTYNGKELLLKGMAMTSVTFGVYSAKFLRDSQITFTPKILHEDIDFNMKVYPHAKRVMYMDLDVYHYCVTTGSILRSEDLHKRIHLMKSKFDVAANVLRMVQATYDPEITRYYKRNSSSMTFGSIFSLMSETVMNHENRRDCINYARTLGVYPIRHRTSSIKSTLLIPLVNSMFLLELLKKLGCFRKQRKAIWE